MSVVDVDVLSREDLRELSTATTGPCVSIYLPTHRVGPEIQQDPIRLKNLLREAEEALAARGMRGPEIKAFLEPAHALLPERPFWQHQAQGLALFRSPDLFRTYRLPLSFEELAAVNDRFYVKPLLPLLSDGRFYILAVSQNEVRLLQADRYHTHEVPLPPEVPKNLDDALKYDEAEESLQFRLGARGGREGHAGIFHGHGSVVDETGSNRRRYCLQIDRGLHDILRNERAPLVLASVEYMQPIYREANTYTHLAEGGIIRNPEGMRPEELRAQAWEILEPQFTEAQRRTSERYHQVLGTGLASNNIMEIVPSAYQGRVDSLFVALGVQQCGRFDPESQAVHLQPEGGPGTEDLLDLAAVQTFLHGGAVYAVPPEEVPGGAPLAALFRY